MVAGPRGVPGIHTRQLRFAMIPPLLVLVVICFALAVPALIGDTSLKRFGRAMLVSALGVMLPLLVFFLSAFLVPEWRGACRHGWFDCFHLGKLMLTPLVLWATGALYVREVCCVEPPYTRGLVQGLFMGTLVAGGCFVYGGVWVCLGVGVNTPVLWLLVPLYVALWHGIRLVQALEPSKPAARDCALSLLGSLPLWIGGVFWSQRIFEALPKNPPQCFVVTAASRGHRGLVGPLIEIERHGCRRWANRQLVTFWNFEAQWQRHAPTSHAMFRRIYNRLGAALARRIVSPWQADVVYLALKPAEWFARLMLYETHPAAIPPEVKA
jgi:hypothetical protein